MTPDDCDECFRRALTRAAILLNGAAVPGLVAQLRQSDTVVRDAVAASPEPKKLFLYLPSHADGQLAFDEYASFFYGVTRVADQNPDGLIRTVEHQTRPAFTQLFRRGSFPPRYTDEQMGLVPLGESPRERSLAFGTNYLVKNLWHNLVHVHRQEINDSNFHFFGGQARETSDFTADHLATVLHALSYGLRVEATSKNAPLSPDPDIVFLQRRNRCNRLFAIRAELIHEKRPDSYDASEHSWRIRRTIAVYVSGWLTAAGRAPASLSVQFTRRMSDTERALAIEVNGIFYALDIPIVDVLSGIPDPEQRLVSRDRLREIALAVDERYYETLGKQPRLAQYAQEALAAQVRVFGVSSTT